MSKKLTKLEYLIIKLLKSGLNDYKIAKLFKEANQYPSNPESVRRIIQRVSLNLKAKNRFQLALILKEKNII